MRSARIIYFEEASSAVPQIVFQVPVDPDGDSDVLDNASGDIDWGAYEATGDVEDNFMGYVFMQVGAPLSESAAGHER